MHYNNININKSLLTKYIIKFKIIAAAISKDTLLKVFHLLSFPAQLVQVKELLKAKRIILSALQVKLGTSRSTLVITEKIYV